MPTISVKCPNCGAPLQAKEDSCRYCQAMVLFTPDLQEVRLVGFPCPKCKAPNDKGIRFCSKCGGPLQIKCSSCRHDMPYDAAICPHCRASRVVKSLIAEADERRHQLDQETQQALADVDQQVQQHECFKKVACRLQADAETLKLEAAQVLATKSKSQLLAILSFVGTLLVPLIFCVVTGSLSAIMESKGHAIPGSGPVACCFPIFLFIAFLVAAIMFQVKVSGIAKKGAALQQKAGEMVAPEAWKTFSNGTERQAIQAVLDWGQEQKNVVLAKQQAHHADIDKWLEDSTDALT